MCYTKRIEYGTLHYACTYSPTSIVSVQKMNNPILSWILKILAKLADVQLALLVSTLTISFVLIAQYAKKKGRELRQ